MATTKRSTGKGKPAARKRPPARTREQQRLAPKYLFPRGRVSAKGWVVIPKEIREEMGLKPGDEVQFALWPPPLNMKQDRALYSLHIIRIPEDPGAVVNGMFIRRPGDPLMTERLIEERRREREEEERRLPPPRRRKRRVSA